MLQKTPYCLSFISLDALSKNVYLKKKLFKKTLNLRDRSLTAPPNRYVYQFPQLAIIHVL